MNIKTASIFAVKKMSLVSLSSGIRQERVQQLMKEIQVLKKLNHENIVHYIGSELVDQQFFIYLEYINQGSIRQVYQKQGPIPEKCIRIYTQQILKGLNYLHENHVAHCDLKAANILVDTKGMVKLSDFGCSKVFENSLSVSDVSTAIRGSLPWTAPEVLRNKGYRRKADIWSVGCTVIEMATADSPLGKQKFDSDFDAIIKIANCVRKPEIPTNVSAECQDFIKRCLQVDYDARPTARELLEHPFVAE